MSTPTEDTSTDTSSTDESELTEEEIERRAAELRARRRTRLWDGVSELAQLAFALLPCFPMDVREQVRPFPEVTNDTLQRLQTEGVLQAKELYLEGTIDRRTVVYQLDTTVRRAILSNWQERLTEVDGLARSLGAKLADFRPERLPPLARWREIVQDGIFSSAVSRVVNTILSRLFQDYQAQPTQASTCLAETARYLEAARDLLPLYADRERFALDALLALGEHRQDVIRRREKDTESLRHYLPRPALDNAFAKFLTSETEASWALHVVGVGGAGKTMFIRHIVRDLVAPDKCLTARVDFDYLNPDYPNRDPGLLLSALALDLRVGLVGIHGGDEAARALDKADSELRALNERISKGEFRGIEALKNSSFTMALDAFAYALSLLTRGNRNVLLILDTCEELAKIRPGGVEPANVRATFEILTRLKEKVAGLRVLFSGRRPLAKAGVGWRLKDADTIPLPERDYLQLLEVRAFDPIETETYLLNRRIPEELRAAVQDASRPEAGRALPLKELAENLYQGSEAPMGERSNPYELDLFADWIEGETRSGQQVSAETIRQAQGAAYVKIRILDRIESEPLRRILPMVVTVGVVTEESLRQLVGSNDPDRADWQIPTDQVAAVYHLLEAQEWTEYRAVRYQMGGVSRTMPALMVEAGMWARLLRYYLSQAETRGVLRAAADYLEETTLHGDLNSFDVATLFPATRRVLEKHDPKRTAIWWERLETRLREERGSDWVEVAASLLLAPDDLLEEAGATLAPPPGPEIDNKEIRPESSALYAVALASCILNSSGPAPLATATRYYQDALDAALHLPGENRRDRITYIAAAASLSLTRARNGEIHKAALAHFKRLLPQMTLLLSRDAELCSATFAGLEAVLEIAIELGHPANRIAAPLPLHRNETALDYPACLPDLPSKNTLKTCLDPLSDRVRRADSDAGADLLYPWMVLTRMERDILQENDTEESEIDQLLVRLSLTGRLSERSKEAPFSRHWLFPESPSYRCLLERLRDGMEPFGVTADLSKELAQTLSTDADRYFAAFSDADLVRVLFEGQHDSPQKIPEFLHQESLRHRDAETQREINYPGEFTTARCNSHRRTPPLFVRIVQLLASYGDLTNAVALLEATVREPDRFGARTTLWANRALLTLRIRYHLGDGQPPFDPKRLLASSFTDTFLLWADAAVSGHSSGFDRIPSLFLPSTDDSEAFLLYWKCSWLSYAHITAVTTDQAAALRTLTQCRDAIPADTGDRFLREIRRQAEWLLHNNSGDPPTGAMGFVSQFLPELWENTHPAHAEDPLGTAVLLALRSPKQAETFLVSRSVTGVLDRRLRDLYILLYQSASGEDAPGTSPDKENTKIVDTFLESLKNAARVTQAPPHLMDIYPEVFRPLLARALVLQLVLPGGPEVDWSPTDSFLNRLAVHHGDQEILPPDLALLLKRTRGDISPPTSERTSPMARLQRWLAIHGFEGFSLFTRVLAFFTLFVIFVVALGNLSRFLPKQVPPPSSDDLFYLLMGLLVDLAFAFWLTFPVVYLYRRLARPLFSIVGLNVSLVFYVLISVICGYLTATAFHPEYPGFILPDVPISVQMAYGVSPFVVCGLFSSIRRSQRVRTKMREPRIICQEQRRSESGEKRRVTPRLSFSAGVSDRVSGDRNMMGGEAILGDSGVWEFERFEHHPQMIGLARSAGWQPIPLPIEAADAIEANWEKPLTWMTGHKIRTRAHPRNGKLPFLFYHPPISVATRTGSEINGRVAIWTMEEEWASPLRDAWDRYTRKTRKGRAVPPEWIPAEASESDALKRAGIVHLIGVVREDSAGDRFEFASRGTAQLPGMGYFSTDIARICASAAICILQLPSEGFTAEIDMGRLRGFAAALQQCGIQIVLALPALHPAVTAEVIARCAEGLRWYPKYGIEPLLYAVNNAREFIAAQSLSAAPTTLDLDIPAAEAKLKIVLQRLRPSIRAQVQDYAGGRVEEGAWYGRFYDIVRATTGECTLSVPLLTAYRYIGVWQVAKYLWKRISLFWWRDCPAKRHANAVLGLSIAAWNKAIMEKLLPEVLPLRDHKKIAEVSFEQATSLCVFAPRPSKPGQASLALKPPISRSGDNDAPNDSGRITGRK